MNYPQLLSYVRTLRMAGGLPAVMLIVALVASLLAAREIDQTIMSIRKISTQESVLRAEVQKSPLTADDYKAVAESNSRMHTHVKFKLSSDQKIKGLLISIDSAASYNEWLQALSVLHSRLPGVLWEVKEFCVGRCVGGAAIAQVEGIRQSVSIKGN